MSGGGASMIPPCKAPRLCGAIPDGDLPSGGTRKPQAFRKKIREHSGVSLGFRWFSGREVS
eukprot:5498745-Pyramimonas_sp.AAC.1